MCGIAGIIGKKTNAFENQRVLQSIMHRGPNSFGTYSTKDITFIHTRLSILDVSKNGNQPMKDEKTGIIILYNGEIYNFQDLKKKEFQNHKFISNTDTEVILKLYIKYGIKSIRKLEGMFAISIWDPRKKKLFLVRDRFGIKPMFYYHNHKVFAFSSEIKPILNFKIKPNLDETSLANYLKYGLLATSNKTFFKDIFSVPPGSIITFYQNRISLSKYWDFENNVSSNILSLNEQDIEKETFNLTKKITQDHLISDVPVGLCLSSGSDSQLLLNFIKNENLKKIECFTFGFDEEKYDEIRKLKYNNLDSDIIFNSIILKQKNLIKELEKSIKDFECPIGGLGAHGLWKLMKVAKKRKIPVLLSGEGADETFCGYKYYYHTFLLELYQNNQFELLNREASYLKKKLGSKSTINKNFLKNLAHRSAQAPDGTSLEGESFLKKNGVYASENKDEFKKTKVQNSFSLLKNRMYEDLFFLKIPKLLWFADRSSMSSGIECRVPFLDRRLVEHCFSLPSNLLIRNGVNKYLIRNFLKKRFNQEYQKEEKLLVATPQREWIKFSFKGQILKYIKNGFLMDKNIIDYKLFNKEYDAYSQSKKLGNSFNFWKILNVEILCRNFFN